MLTYRKLHSSFNSFVNSLSKLRFQTKTNLKTNKNKSAKPKLSEPTILQPKFTHKLATRASYQIRIYIKKSIQSRVKCNYCWESYKTGTDIGTHKRLANRLKSINLNFYLFQNNLIVVLFVFHRIFFLI